MRWENAIPFIFCALTLSFVKIKNSDSCFKRFETNKIEEKTLNLESFNENKTYNPQFTDKTGGFGGFETDKP